MVTGPAPDVEKPKTVGSRRQFSIEECVEPTTTVRKTRAVRIGVEPLVALGEFARLGRVLFDRALLLRDVPHGCFPAVTDSRTTAPNRRAHTIIE